jgi:hypothetical protein
MMDTCLKKEVLKMGLIGQEEFLPLDILEL